MQRCAIDADLRPVSKAEFARRTGVNRSTVTRWIKNGRIEADAFGRIDPEAAARMRIATESPLPHHQARKAQIDAIKRADPERHDGARIAEWALFEAQRMLKDEQAALAHQQRRVASAVKIVEMIEHRIAHGKACARCSQTKPLSEFMTTSANFVDGHEARCIDCRRADRREYARDLSERLDDRHIRRLIAGKRARILKPEDIPQALVDAKRAQLMILRWIDENRGEE